MTAIPISVNFPVDEAKEKLMAKFPNYKIKSAFLNKKALNIVDGLAMAVVVQRKDSIRIIGNLNIMKGWVFLVFVLLLFFTLVGGLLFYGIIWYQNKEKIKALEEEIATFLKNQFESY